MGTITQEEAVPSSTMEEEMMMRGKPSQPTIEYIPVYVPQRMEVTLVIKIGKDNKYAINMPTTPNTMITHSWNSWNTPRTPMRKEHKAT